MERVDFEISKSPEEAASRGCGHWAGQPRGGKRAAFPTQEKLQGLAFWAGCPFSSIGFSSPLSKADQYVPFFPIGSHKAES